MATAPYQDAILTRDEAGQHYTSSDGALSVLDGGRVFMRNAIHINEQRRSRWLVGELNGVRCYVNGNNVILTTQDLNP